MKEYLLAFFSVSIVENDTEGIMWIKFIAKDNDFTFLMCICYLPPIDSCRHVDAGLFF